MKKILRSPLLIGLLAFFAALVGFFLRSIQLRTELLADGSLAEGSYLHILLLVLSGLCVVIFVLALSQMEKESGWQRIFSGKPLPNTLQIVSAVVLLTGNVILLLQGGPAIAASRAPAIAQLLSRLEAPLGLLAALCLILFAVSFGMLKMSRFFTYNTFRKVTSSALLVYAASKAYSFYTGANHLESYIPLGTPGAILSSGLILVLDICVGIVVACTMYGFYALFTKGEL